MGWWRGDEKTNTTLLVHERDREKEAGEKLQKSEKNVVNVVEKKK